MRPIKFRAWDKDSNMMWGTNNVLLQFHKIIGNERFILEQFTGLLDKNGKEIYEGDMVWCFDDIKAIVVWNGGSCAFMLDYQLDHDDGSGEYGKLDIGTAKQTEVIGNIHSNPELLTQ